MEAIDRYVLAAKQAGCPREQIENFIRFGYVAQEKQLRFHAASRKCDTGEVDQVGIGGARGGGKSHAVFAQAALDDCQRVPNLKVLYLRKVGKQAREQFEDLRRAVLFSVPHKYNRHSGVVEFPNGSRILIGNFRTESDVDNYLGIEYDLIVIEEATSLTASKYKALRDSNRTSKSGWIPRIYTSTNPGGVGHAWYKRRYIIGEPGTVFIPSTVDDNKFIDSGYKRKLEENTGWKLRAYRYGDWDIAAGQFFSTWDASTHVIEPFQIPKSWEVWGALDYGFIHPTAVLLFARDGDGTIYVIGEYGESKTQVSTHAAAIRDLALSLKIAPERIHPFVAGADAFARKTDAPTIAQKYKQHGIRLSVAANDRIQGAAELLARLGDPRQDIPPSIYFFDTCVRTIQQVPAMMHDPHRPEDVLKVDIDEDGTGGDDFYDTLRYGIMTQRRKAKRGKVDWYAPVIRRETIEASRTEAEVEEILNGYTI